MKKYSIKSVVEDYKVLLRNVPATVTVVFVLGTVLMNLAASKIIFNFHGVAGTGGLILSFLPFLCMDVVTKHFGARAAIMLNILSALGNLFSVIFLAIVAAIPTATPYPEFNYIFGSVWFICLSSTVAFIISGVANSLIHSALGKLFVKNPDGKLAFFFRSYVSTFIGQFIDNFLFMYGVYVIFGPAIWGIDPLPVWTCVGTGILGGVMELLVEVVFSPLGYITCRRWKAEGVGEEYRQLHCNNR